MTQVFCTVALIALAACAQAQMAEPQPRIVTRPDMATEVTTVEVSEWREEQEGLLLMAVHGWVRTSVGKYTLKPVACEPRRARLELTLAEEI